MTEHESILLEMAHDDNDTIANYAMKRLQTEFDPNYRFCPDCDGLVTNQACSENCVLDLPYQQKQDENIEF